ncbi:hypothetical protein N7535_006040 [Penicillium sp. DV-2018c]|nr:hypothetical protein N7535_006040 [Penicillium sp. DV-2018c]
MACGLVNDTFETVRDIVWPASTTDARNEAPLALFIEFDLYTGPPYFESPDAKVVPIFRSLRHSFSKDGQCSRTRFPVTIGYAMVHKAQVSSFAGGDVGAKI